ncbi:MAG: AAA family ATPase [Anaerolineae bacterium]|nr:AAA family ATPase [Anaerolineae bacterium]
MIVFINGPFGVGKTTVAERLVQRLPGGLLFDPEWIGFVIKRTWHRLVPYSDYQDDRLWRRLTVFSIKTLARSGRPLVVPMSIWRTDYFDEIVGCLRREKDAAHHFCLTASSEVLHARLTGRGDAPGSFAFLRIEPCVAAFQSPLFDLRLPTDDQTPDALVITILAHLPA